MIRECKHQDHSQWHRWFAWHPVTTEWELEGAVYRSKWIWWEWVYRRFYNSWGGLDWEYKLYKPCRFCKEECLPGSNACEEHVPGSYWN